MARVRRLFWVNASLKGCSIMKKITATVALASLLVLVGCAQGTASPSAGASSASVSSAATSSQSPDASDASGGQPQAPSAETPAASSAASAESGASPQSGAASAEHVDSFAIGVGDTQLVVTLADTDAARALAEKLQEGPVTVSLHAYGGFEKVGPLPWGLPASDGQTTAQPGDVMLYQGNQIRYSPARTAGPTPRSATSRAQPPSRCSRCLATAMWKLRLRACNGTKRCVGGDALPGKALGNSPPFRADAVIKGDMR